MTKSQPYIRLKILLAATLIVLAAAVLLNRHQTTKVTEPPPPPPPPRATTDKVDQYIERDQVARKQEETLRQGPSGPRSFAHRMQVYDQLAKKVLKTDQERHLFADLLADEATQDRALDGLNAQTSEDQRLVLVDYLIDGMDHQHRDGQAALLEKVYRFLESPVLTDAHDKKSLKSLAADRVELFATLMQIDRALADRLTQGKNSELNRRIFQYARANYGQKQGE